MDCEQARANATKQSMTYPNACWGTGLAADAEAPRSQAAAARAVHSASAMVALQGIWLRLPNLHCKRKTRVCSVPAGEEKNPTATPAVGHRRQVGEASDDRLIMPPLPASVCLVPHTGSRSASGERLSACARCSHDIARSIAKSACPMPSPL